MIYQENETRTADLLTVAQAMMRAARTAPKAKGKDMLEIATVTGDSIKELSAKMVELSPIVDKKFFLRDAANILNAEAVVLIGTRLHIHSLNCGYCGFSTCGAKPDGVPCAFVMNDLGIAIGSAASVAADNRVDSRVMYSVGVAAMALEMMPRCHAVLAIPISCSGKSPFFDR